MINSSNGSSSNADPPWIDERKEESKKSKKVRKIFRRRNINSSLLQKRLCLSTLERI